MSKLMASILLLGTTLFCSCSLFNREETATSMTHTVWDIDDPSSIAGHATTVLGSPAVIETGIGKAVEFDGVKDGLIVDALPLAGAQEFTLEIIFRPDADGPAEQRFLHLQENDAENRILIETRVQGDKWYLDTYIDNPRGNLALFDANNTHPTGRWYNAALTYDGGTMRHYVNGVEEMSGRLVFTPLAQGKTSIGVRMNRVFWFKGTVCKVRFTPLVLEPEQFLRP